MADCGTPRGGGRHPLRHCCSAGRGAAVLSAVLVLLGVTSGPCPTIAPPYSLSTGLPTIPGRTVTVVPVLDNGEAWKHLPAAVRGGGQPLPVWARALARTLPRTTATMLELDYAQRCESPLEPLLRGRIRWIAAHGNQCRYSEAFAAADLRRSGLDEAGLRALSGDWAQLPEAQRAALLFARKLTEEASSITDAEVAYLIEKYGEKAVVAMALLVAHANFQDRLILALNLPLEPDGPLPPLDVRFARIPLGASHAGPPRVQPPGETGNTTLVRIADSDWQQLNFDRLQKELSSRRARGPRINLSGENPGAIHWGAVCNRYQPELAARWTACAQAFGDEANQDPVFEQFLLWVVSRSSKCFYCLGHTAMLLAVAGLNEQDITERTQCLASGDWSKFSPADRAALLFARKTKTPASLTTDNYQELVRHFGPDRALDVVWWTCRCHYMNRVADAFQLPLESENVFDGFRPEIGVSRKPK
jgi:alkylhydroperoxidase family enzyme